MGLDIITRVTIICDKCGAKDSLLSKDNDNNMIGILLEHLSEGNGWSIIPDGIGKASFCYCPHCKTEVE